MITSNQINSSLRIKGKSLYFILLLLVAYGCRPGDPVSAEPDSPSELKFEPRKIVTDASYWWAHCPADISGDGIADLVYIHNNSTGGPLGYRIGKRDSGLWETVIIAEKTPNDKLFAAGDLEVADLDGDGDMDVLGVEHPGEWQDANAPANLFWYENPAWNVHPIGTVPDAVKDMNFADFDNDGKMDLAILTFEENTLSIFRQISADEWERVQYFHNYKNLHEGMSTGDINGDGYLDIAANGLVFYNPGTDLNVAWSVENLDSIWNTQTGDWSRNGTKHFTKDLDGDGQAEIFISHSERAGYPLVYYQKKTAGWEKNVIIDSLAACHTLQVYDFDNDGDQDVLAGVNWARAVNIGQKYFPINIYLSSNNYTNWTALEIGNEGIYNGQAIDYDGDGDYDFIRYPNHESKEVFLFENKLMD